MKPVASEAPRNPRRQEHFHAAARIPAAVLPRPALGDDVSALLRDAPPGRYLLEHSGAWRLLWRLDDGELLEVG
jgi:hypothetical protein